MIVPSNYIEENCVVRLHRICIRYFGALLPLNLAIPMPKPRRSDLSYILVFRSRFIVRFFAKPEIYFL